MTPGRPEAPGSLDFGELFAWLPAAFLVMTPDLVIVEANAAYLQLLGHRRQDLVGRPVFEAFPPSPGAVEEDGTTSLQTSFERVRDTGVADVLPLYRYDVSDPATGEVLERFWSLISAPVLDADGVTTLVVQRVEDVTDYVRERAALRREHDLSEEWRSRTEAVQAELFARTREVLTARAAEQASSRSLAALADVAVQVAQAEDLHTLVEAVVGRGLAVLGAKGGAVAVRHGDVLRLLVTPSLGAQTQVDYAELPIDSPLPAARSTVTASRILLPDRVAALAYDEQMAQVIATTDCQAWAVLPLTSEAEVLGSLAVGWVDAQHFTTSELEVLSGFAAQCSQALARIQAREAEQAAATDALRMSEALQRSLLTEPAQPDGLHVVARYRPAAEQAQVGGDWYDSFVTSAGVTTLVVGDVVGHDREAAAVMGQIRNVARGIAYTLGEPPAVILTQLDRALRDLDVDALATAVLLAVEQTPAQATEGTHTLRWSNAGHPPPLLLHRDGRAELLTSDPELLLGVDADTSRTHQEVTLRPGARLLLYTDGLVERRTGSVDDGLAWLAGTVTTLAGHGIDELCDELLRLVAGHAEDDVVLLALEASPVGEPLPAAQRVLPRTTATVGLARRVVTDACRAAGMPQDAIDTAVLLTSEAVTNAVVHGRGDVRLGVTATADRVRIEVGDDGGHAPAPRPAGPDAVDGRGLHLIDALAGQWGVREERAGKTVWLQVDC